jgi:hypothetical protein
MGITPAPAATASTDGVIVNSWDVIFYFLDVRYHWGWRHVLLFLLLFLFRLRWRRQYRDYLIFLSFA